MISKEEYEVTRTVTLKNVNTGSVIRCFDDSDMGGEHHKDFSFMKEGVLYNCKIELYGGTQPGRTAKKALCRVLRDNVACGRVRLVEVLVEGDTYYIPYQEVKPYLKEGYFNYYYTRKDLIQVDDVIHGDYQSD